MGFWGGCWRRRWGWGGIGFAGGGVLLLGMRIGAGVRVERVGVERVVVERVAVERVAVEGGG